MEEEAGPFLNLPAVPLSLRKCPTKRLTLAIEAVYPISRISRYILAVKRDYHGILTEESVCKQGAEHAGDQLELLSFSGSEPYHTGFPLADGKRTEVTEYH